MNHVLFVCTLNISRSPTAERAFASYPGIETRSAGTSDEANQPLTSELVRWAHLIVVMEPRHRDHVQSAFAEDLGERELVCLDIPDIYDFEDPRLLDLLNEKVPSILVRLPARSEGSPA